MRLFGNRPALASPVRLEFSGEQLAETRRLVLIAPVALIVTMYAVFHVVDAWATRATAYFAGFAVYWLLWGIVVPLMILGRDAYLDIVFSRSPERHRLPWRAALLLAAPPLVAFIFVFPSFFPSPSEAFVLALVVYALVNGILEEVFWRGLFSRVFPTEMGRGLFYPAAMYAAWFLVPLSLYPPWTLTDAASVLAVGFAVGLLYGWVAWRTGSVRWTILSHVLMNLGGIGALILFQV